MLTKITFLTKLKTIVEILPLCDEKMRQGIEYLVVVFGVGYSVYLAWTYKLDFNQWDILLLTGAACFYIGLKEVSFLRGRFEGTVKRLVERGVILLKNEQSIDSINKEYETTGHAWMRITGLICATAMLLAFIVAIMLDYKLDRLLLAVPEVIGAYIAGNYIGRMIWYGQLGSWLSKHHKHYQIDPSHVDGLCGLKPVGEYYFYQASIASIPAVFLAVWWLLIPIWPRDYGHWHDAYFGLLVIAIIIEILAFIIPLFSFHKLMNERKKALISEADTLSVKISKLKADVAKNQDSGETKQLKEQLDEINGRYWSIENMRTWPVDIKTRKRFSINNIFLFVPVIYNSFQQTFKFDDFLKVFSNFQF